MMRLPALAVAAILLWAQPAQAKNCSTSDPFPFESQYAIQNCPEDIQKWMDRVNACAHFSGEEGYDADRKSFIDQEMKKNGCDRIGCDFDALFGKYEGDIAYTGVMFDYLGFVYGGEENAPKCPEQ